MNDVGVIPYHGDGSEKQRGDAVAWLREQITWWRDHAQREVARRPMTPMRSHELRGMGAACEAHLAILDEHFPSKGHDQPAGDLTLICYKCADDRMYGYPYPCGTVRLVASAYRHAPGYAEHWGEPA